MSKKGIHHAWVILFAACIMMGTTIGIVGQSAGIFFSPVAKELGVGRGPLALYMTIQAIVTMLTLPFAGRMLPKLSFRLVQTFAAIGVLGSFLAMSQYHSLIGWYISGAVFNIIGTMLIKNYGWNLSCPF